MEASPPRQGRVQVNSLMESAEKQPRANGPDGPNIITNESDIESSHADIGDFVSREFDADLNLSGMHSAQIRTHQRKKNAQKGRENRERA